MKILSFKDIFISDELPKTLNVCECGIINLGDGSARGSHLTVYEYKQKYYFDSYGDANPLVEFIELIEYLGSKNYNYNGDKSQNYNGPLIFVDIIV